MITIELIDTKTACLMFPIKDYETHKKRIQKFITEKGADYKLRVIPVTAEFLASCTLSEQERDIVKHIEQEHRIDYSTTKLVLLVGEPPEGKTILDRSGSWRESDGKQRDVKSNDTNLNPINPNGGCLDCE